MKESKGCTELTSSSKMQRKPGSSNLSQPHLWLYRSPSLSNAHKLAQGLFVCSSEHSRVALQHCILRICVATNMTLSAQKIQGFQNSSSAMGSEACKHENKTESFLFFVGTR